MYSHLGKNYYRRVQNNKKKIRGLEYYKIILRIPQFVNLINHRQVLRKFKI